jgi:hypothetical protein
MSHLDLHKKLSLPFARSRWPGNTTIVVVALSISAGPNISAPAGIFLLQNAGASTSLLGFSKWATRDPRIASVAGAAVAEPKTIFIGRPIVSVHVKPQF